ncbi:MAG: DMT family transporter [Ktedonobacteraceae bacterium]
MRMKILAGSGFLLNTILFATYYAVAKEALSRIDPIIFTFFEMLVLVPVALLIILCSWKKINRAVVQRGILLGSVLCLALFTIAIALKYTTATSTAFFPALNGFVAALIAWALFREPLKGTTWLAGLLALGGAALLIFTAPMGNWRGTLIAFLGGLFYTCYVFLCDREQKAEKAHWALFGVELLTTAVWANLVALLFGDWQAVHPALPKDIIIVLFVAGACTFVPVLITVLLQKYISPITVSFIYILEPVLGGVVAYLYLRETLPIQGYIGGGLVVLGAVIHTWGTLGRPVEKRAPTAQRVQGSWVSTVLYPGASCILGAVLLSYLGGLPPNSWREVSHLWPQLAQDMQQGQGTYVTLLLVQAGGWLVAWLSVLVMGSMACYHTLRRMRVPAQPRYAIPQPKEARPTQPMQFVQRTTARALIQPTNRVQTTVRVPEQPARRVVARVPEQSIQRTTASLPEQPVRRTTAHLPEQSTWYGESVWSAPPAAGHGRGYPSTEPLQHEAVPPMKRRASLTRQEAIESF